MTTQTELLREALELADAYANAFNNCGSSLYNPTTAAARKALADKIAALTQPEQPAPKGWKPETERADLVAMVDTAMIAMAGIYPPLRRKDCERLIRAALISADSKDAGEPVAGYVDAHELKMLQKGALEPTISREPVSDHDVPLYTRPQAADAQPLTA